jgi:Trypsin
MAVFCFMSMNLSSTAKDLIIKAGSSNLWTNQLTTVNVNEVVIHHQFDGTQQDFDVALIGLTSQLEVASNIQPAYFLPSAGVINDAKCISTHLGRRRDTGQ